MDDPSLHWEEAATGHAWEDHARRNPRCTNCGISRWEWMALHDPDLGMQSWESVKCDAIQKENAAMTRAGVKLESVEWLRSRS